MVGTKSQRNPWRYAPAALLTALLTLLLATIPASAAQDFGDPVPGQRIYDRTNTLTATELRDLENRANAVAAAGAPTIVYLRAKNADEDDTQRDARDLMAAWSVESAPGARDGVVIFMNLDPKNTRHGQLALFAGERHYQHGNLPERELQRIFDDEMRPLLADEQTAAGLGAGLNAIANSLTYGPAPPPQPTTPHPPPPPNPPPPPPAPPRPPPRPTQHY
ncbi:MAG: TPM domain-containing protein [Thermomicrobiales bacterium]